MRAMFDKSPQVSFCVFVTTLRRTEVTLDLDFESKNVRLCGFYRLSMRLFKRPFYAYSKRARKKTPRLQRSVEIEVLDA